MDKKLIENTGKWEFLLVIPILYAFLFSAPRVEGYDENFFSVPRVSNGDEPHYLVAISSFITDFDFDVSNNYENARAGGPDAGRIFSSRKLDHHTVWYEQDQRVEWHSKWGISPDDMSWQEIESLPSRPEYPTHPIGFAALIGSVLALFQVSLSQAEPCALILLAGFSFWTFRQIKVFFCALNLQSPLLMALICIVSTPLWHYSRALYGEMFIVGFAVAGANAYIQHRPTLTGIYFALAMLIKPVFLIFGIPYGIHLLINSRTKKTCSSFLSFAIPITCSVAIILLVNEFFFGSPFRSPQEFRFGSIVTGLTGLLFSPTKGLLGTAPICLICFLRPDRLLGEKRLSIILPILGSLLYFLVMSLWADWAGGSSYGPRLIVPTLPFLFAASTLCISVRMRSTFNLAILLSILINLAAVSPYWRATWDHPVRILIQSFLADTDL